ncbi:MAG: hypothetical protein Q8M24_20405 [Pseudolabrys sp.]|nr:hypothetical protein [Pseudolabrys sp.]MDP2297813.1 hypothetical protein [Pseudolabrys sp.]
MLAIYVFALTTILSTFSAPRPASAAFDPFSVICHSGPQGDATAAQDPAAPASLPTKACDHCTLCFVANALAGPDAIPAGLLAPPAVLHVLTPASSAARAHFAASPHRARGPPQRA